MLHCPGNSVVSFSTLAVAKAEARDVRPVISYSSVGLRSALMHCSQSFEASRGRRLLCTSKKTKMTLAWRMILLRPFEGREETQG